MCKGSIAIYNYGCVLMSNVVLLTTKCVAPYMVATSMSGVQDVSFMVPDPVSYARAAVHWLPDWDKEIHSWLSFTYCTGTLLIVHYYVSAV